MSKETISDVMGVLRVVSLLTDTAVDDEVRLHWIRQTRSCVDVKIRLLNGVKLCDEGAEDVGENAIPLHVHLQVARHCRQQTPMGSYSHMHERRHLCFATLWVLTTR